MDGQILNIILQSLLDQIAMAYGNLLPVALYFFYAVATITLVKLGLAYAFDQNGNIIAALLAKLIKLGFIFWVITNLPYLHEVLRDGAIKLGIKAAGSGSTLDLILNPSEIISYGFKAIMPIKLWVHKLTWSSKTLGPNMMNVLFGGIAMLFILGAFAYLAFQMFMALVDFYFTSILAPIFIAFHLFEPTAWMAVGAIRGPIQHAVKLFTMAFIINMAGSWIGSLMVSDGIKDMQDATVLLLASLVLVALALKAGTWASGVFSGSPTASAGDLVATTAGVVGSAVAGGMVANNALQKTRQAAGSVVGGTIAAGSAAVAGAQLAGIGYQGNSRIGRAITMGVGAAQSTAASVTSTPKAMQERIAKAFNSSVQRGLREAYVATGGSKDNFSGAGGDTLKGVKEAKEARSKAEMYQRIAKAFMEKQNFNND